MSLSEKARPLSERVRPDSEAAKWVIEEIKRLEIKLEYTENRLRDANERVEAAEYRQHVAEWALVGVGRDASGLRMAVSNMGLEMRGTDPFVIAEHMGKTLGRALLRHAELEFREHAKLYEAKQHIRYLEGHASANGLPFTPYLNTVIEDHTDRPPKTWRWVLRSPKEDGR